MTGPVSKFQVAMLYLINYTRHNIHYLYTYNYIHVYIYMYKFRINITYGEIHKVEQ